MTSIKDNIDAFRASMDYIANPPAQRKGVPMSTLKPEHFTGLVSAFTQAIKENVITLAQARDFVEQLTNVVLEETVATKKSGLYAERPPAVVHEMPTQSPKEDRVNEARARAAQRRKAAN